MATRRQGGRGDDERSARRIGRTRRIGTMLPAPAAKIFRKHGFAQARIVTDWAEIVGERLAEVTLPERLGRDGTLTLRVTPAFALEVQHQAPQILERVTTFFGHRAASRLKIAQGPLPPRPTPRHRAPRPLEPAEEECLVRRLEGIDDEDLRRALDGLGRAIVGSSSNKDGA